MLIVVAGCKSNDNEYSAVYGMNFIGMTRKSALAKLAEAEISIRTQRGDFVTDFALRGYSLDRSPDPRQCFYGEWWALRDMDENMTAEDIKKLIDNQVEDGSVVMKAKCWTCCDYLRPSLHMTFTAEKEKLTLWFDDLGIVTNQAVLVFEVK